MFLKSILILLSFITWPFFSFMANNINKGLFINELYYFYVIILATFIFFYVGLRKITNKNNKSLNTAIYLSVSLFMYQVIETGMGDLNDLYSFLVWIFVCLLGVFFIWKIPYKKLSIKLYFIILLALYILPVATIINHKINTYGLVHSSLSQDTYSNIQGIKPNVYFFVLDGFSRADVLKENFSHESTKFISNLEKNGFFIANNSFSNYPLTYLSVSSTLSMDYLLKEGEILKGREPFYPPLNGLGNVQKYFKNQGYKYIHSHPKAWGGTSCAPGDFIDLCLPKEIETLRDAIFINEAVENMLKMTPVAYLLNRLYEYYPLIDDGMKNIGLIARLQHIEQIKSKVNSFLNYEPFFLFAHIFSPHPPNTYGESCEMVIDFDSDLVPWSAPGYPRQIKCLEDDLIEMIEKIVRLDKSNPIIILQGDHGASSRGAFGKELKNWDEGDILERYGILNAILLPNECNELLYDSMTPVNTFNIIKACLTGEPVQLLPDISLFSTYETSPDYGLVKTIIRDGKLVD